MTLTIEGLEALRAVSESPSTWLLPTTDNLRRTIHSLATEALAARERDVAQRKVLGEMAEALKPFAHIAAVMGFGPPPGPGGDLILRAWHRTGGEVALCYGDCVQAQTALSSYASILPAEGERT